MHRATNSHLYKLVNLLITLLYGDVPIDVCNYILFCPFRLIFNVFYLFFQWNPADSELPSAIDQIQQKQTFPFLIPDTTTAPTPAPTPEATEEDDYLGPPECLDKK